MLKTSRHVTRILSVFTLLSLGLFSHAAHAQSYRWTGLGGANTDWTVAANWTVVGSDPSIIGVPGSGDTAKNVASATISTSIGIAVLDSPITLANNGQLSVDGSVILINGTLGGSGTYNLTGLTATGGNLNTATFNLRGKTTMLGTTGGGAAIINIPVGATCEFPDDTGSITGTLTTINVLGTLKKTGGTGTNTVDSTCNNSGLIQCLGGRLNLGGGGGTQSGTFDLAGGATIALIGAHTLNFGTNFTGSG